MPSTPGRRALLLAAFLISAAHAQDRANLCAACHGPDGNSSTPGVPSIAGQPQAFLEMQLILFREGLRDSPEMAPVVKGLSDVDVGALARHFAALPARASASGADAVLMKRGRELAGQRHCGQCHLGDFTGQAQIPRLAGQREEYLAEQLRAYREGRRVGSDTSMNEAMYRVPDADITALAHFLSRVAPRARAR